MDDTRLQSLDLAQVRDARMVERMMRHPDWEMPDNFEKVLPAKLAVALARLTPGSRAWLSVMRILVMMHESNRRAAPKEPTDINLNVSGDFAAALQQVAGLSPDERAKLAEADRIFERMTATSDN